MISKKTSDQIVMILDQELGREKAKQLIGRLIQVEGNKSFVMSMRAIFYELTR